MDNNLILVFCQYENSMQKTSSFSRIVLVYFLYRNERKIMSEKVRSIRLPEFVWNALDADAERCRRSSQKQIEALLVTFYEIDDVEINKAKLKT